MPDMPDNHKLHLHIEYRVLYAADLRTIVKTFERAYNILQKSEEPGRRMRRADRLTVQTARTGNSLTLIALGGMGLVAVGRLIALRKDFWESEKAKWDAKMVKRDYEDKERQEKIEQVESALDRKTADEQRAAEIVEKLIKFIDKSKDIVSIEVEIDGSNDDSHKPDALIIHTGRKFR
jgi:hypothetical protein